MWTCPECKQLFINKNQWHSCAQNTLENFLRGKPEKSVELFHCFIDTYKQISDFRLHPAKTRIALAAKMRFASVNRLGKDFLGGHLVLTQHYTDELCFHRVDQFGERVFVHNFRLYDQHDLTEKFKDYMKKAYSVGLREHIER